MAQEFWVLTKVVDDSDSCWDVSHTFCGSPDQLRKVVDLSRGVPFGWRLLKNKAARRFLKWSLKQELRWAREQAARRHYGGAN